MPALSARLRLVLMRMTRRLWFRAALYALVGVGTALLGTVLRPWLPQGVAARIGASAVGNILGILASSMLAVTTFSLSTMVAAYSTAGSSATPRAAILLVEDSIAQRALATFIGVFLFSVVGLIALSTGIYGDSGRVVLFGVTIVMIVVIVVTLLRWIEQLSRLGRVAETVDRVERAARRALQQRAEAPTLAAADWEPLPEDAAALHGESVGYVAHVDLAALQSVADEHDLTVWVAAEAGHFATPDQPLAWLSARPQEAVRAGLLDAFVITDQRDFQQDPRFGLVVLTEVAQRALSPAVNDPGTAIDVLGTVTRLLCDWAATSRHAAGDGHRPRPAPRHPRVRLRALDPRELLEDVFAPLARDSAGMLEVAIHLHKALATLATLGHPALRDAARGEATRALELSDARLALASDRERLHRLADWRHAT
ncbi:MAG: DUF2254 domain-containing protein [Xanthomonadaceae bacterium]|nr:DUF2254 domain-containing protein [Xanthomonadaceae bacterium]MDE1963632.1 DUF2254 domain-containing protein [Xanthomonadaceae bacterium]